MRAGRGLDGDAHALALTHSAPPAAPPLGAGETLPTKHFSLLRAPLLAGLEGSGPLKLDDGNGQGRRGAELPLPRIAPVVAFRSLDPLQDRYALVGWALPR